MTSSIEDIAVGYQKPGIAGLAGRVLFFRDVYFICLIKLFI